MILKKKFDIFYLDPPWSYNSKAYHKGKFRGGPCGHYSLLSLKDLAGLNLAYHSADNSIMFLWATWPMLKDQIALMESWGWEYRTMAFIWTKLNKTKNSLFMGPGYYTRANTEPCLLGVRGECIHPESHSVLQPVITRIGRHSEKPEEVRSRIELLYPQLENRIELFATRRAEGWDTFGMALDGQDVRTYIQKR
jgi:N6-adenosine-specific RNA methylase IME4